MQNPEKRPGNLIDDVEAQGLVEYAMILGLLAIGVIGAIRAIGNPVDGLLGDAASKLAQLIPR